MGCSEESAEEKMLLTKLERLEVQVRKEKELKKLAELEGKDIKSLGQLQNVEEKTDFLNKINQEQNSKPIKTSINKEKKKKGLVKKKKVKIQNKSEENKKAKSETSKKEKSSSKSKSKKKTVSEGGRKKKKK